MASLLFIDLTLFIGGRGDMAFKGAIRLTAKDNVATALENIESGAMIEIRLGDKITKINALDRIPFGFKVAIRDIGRGGPIIKYGESIGVASLDIKEGHLVHIHNLEGTRGRGDLSRGGEK
jgi:altronate dehydratase small subunit